MKEIMCKGKVKLLMNMNNESRIPGHPFDLRGEYSNMCLVFNNYVEGVHASDEGCGRISFKTMPATKAMEAYDLMSGEEFLESVLSGVLTDYDGFVCDVFIDDYQSNIRLYIDGIDNEEECRNGEKIVDVTIDCWKLLCKAHDVKVDWANK